MRGSRKFCQRGSNSDGFFLFLFFCVWGAGGGGGEDRNSTKSGPSSVHQ